MGTDTANRAEERVLRSLDLPFLTPTPKGQGARSAGGKALRVPAQSGKGRGGNGTQPQANVTCR